MPSWHMISESTTMKTDTISPNILKISGVCENVFQSQQNLLYDRINGTFMWLD